MILVSADPDLVVSPRIVVAMGCIVYLFATLDIAIEYHRLSRDCRVREDVVRRQTQG